MAASSYDEALRRLLAHEGGYSNHPSDPGGPTKFGITIGDYRKYVNESATAADVCSMPLATARRIYREHYWHPMHCDELPAGIDYCLFDYAVNSGTARAAKVLQRCLGVPVSGKIDSATLHACAKPVGQQLIEAICDERLRFLRGLKTWPVFGNGWSRRVREVRVAALTMADTTEKAPPTRDRPTAPTTGKGSVPLNTGACNTTAGGTIAAGGSAAAQSHDPSTIVIVMVLTISIAVGAWFF